VGTTYATSGVAPYDVLDLLNQSLTPLLENEASRDEDGNLGSGGCRAYNRELTPDARGALAHSLQTEMPVLPTIRDCRVDANAIVANTHTEIVRVVQFHFQLTALRVCAGISYRFRSDEEDLVTDDRVHVLSVANHSDGCVNGAARTTFFDRSLESFRKIISLCA
jgi:hypothetical protein